MWRSSSAASRGPRRRSQRGEQRAADVAGEANGQEAEHERFNLFPIPEILVQQIDHRDQQGEESRFLHVNSSVEQSLPHLRAAETQPAEEAEAQEELDASR